MKYFNFIVMKNVVILVLVVSVLFLGISLVFSNTNEHNIKDIQVLVKDDKKEIKVPVANSDDSIKKPSEGDSLSAANSKAETESKIHTETVKPEIKIDKSATLTVKPNAVLEKPNMAPIKPDKSTVKKEPPKVKPKTLDATTNKNKVPTYTEQQVKPQPQTTPQDGETNSKGQTYLPGFGWVDNQGGGGQGTKVDSNGDINKQVGTMN